MSMPLPVRVWPAWVILAVQAALMVFTVSAEFDNFSRFVAMMAGPLACMLAFLIYWLGFSRLRWSTKFGVLAVSLLAVVALVFLGHESIRSALWIYGVPLSMFLMAVGITLAGTDGYRRGLASLLVVAGWGAFAFARLDGFDGTYFPEFAWRWSPTRGEDRVASPSPAIVESEEPFPTEITAADWPGFRGADRDSRVRGVAINTNWEKKVPKIIWKVPVGTAWSSMSIVGDWLFTQEQIGDSEAIVCYDAKTGKERWRHVDASCFKEIVSGPGPRATPTIADSHLFAVGGMGLIHCLEAGTGKPIWERDLMKEYKARLPEWGFSCSPLVIAGLAIVYVDGENDRGLVAFDAATGKEIWHVPSRGMNYSSGQRMFLADKETIAFASDRGLLGIDPPTGKVLWEIKPAGWKMAPMVQPQLVEGSSVILSIGDGAASAKVTVTNSNDAWSAKTDWESKNLKPSFNDYVYLDGALYGFDQNIFACVDASTGKRLWKKGRYGFGQCLLFEDSKGVLIVTETGEIVLLAADTKQHRELGTFQAVEGKTWNHPAFAHGILYVRSGEEMAAIDLSP
jgi:outer membrane protein assembly factor BamB